MSSVRAIRSPLLPFAAVAVLLAACARSAPEPGPQPEPNAAGTTAGAGMAGHDMAGGMAGHAMGGGMAGHDMGAMPPVTIPEGALYTKTDVQFMQGMIAHHAQAIVMTNMAEAAGAGPRLLKLARKIDLSQSGEIVLMQEWLRANGQVAPDTSSWRRMRMTGMLTMDELADLEASRGEEFDKRFLRYMIKHHEGALTMVADLMADPRAAQDVDVSVFAADVEAVQTAEIGLMQQMLLEYR